MFSADGGWRLSIRDRSSCSLEALIEQPPETFRIHTAGYAHAAVVRLGDHRPTYLSSLLLITAMPTIGYDIDVPSLASVVRESRHRARHGFQKHSHSDWIMEWGSLCEAIDLAVGMGEKHEEVVKHLSEIHCRYR